MHRPYVGILKNHTDQIKMDKKVHLGEMDFFVHFFKVGLFAPALVFEIVNHHFFYAHQSHPHIPSTSIENCPWSADYEKIRGDQI